MIRLMLVDDHPIVRNGMRRILEAAGDVAVVAEAGSGEEAQQLLETRAVDIVLLDVSMPGVGGLETLRRIGNRHPRIKVIGLSMYKEGPYPFHFLRAGAKGYLHKGAAPAEMLQAIRKVAEGERYVSSNVAMGIATGGAEEPLPPAGRALSRRELQVLHHIALGRDLDEIAGVLSLTVHSVRTYRRRLLDKLGLHNDVQLAAAAIARGIIDFGDQSERS